MVRFKPLDLVSFPDERCCVAIQLDEEAATVRSILKSLIRTVPVTRVLPRR